MPNGLLTSRLGIPRHPTRHDGGCDQQKWSPWDLVGVQNGGKDNESLNYEDNEYHQEWILEADGLGEHDTEIVEPLNAVSQGRSRYHFRSLIPRGIVRRKGSSQSWLVELFSVHTPIWQAFLAGPSCACKLWSGRHNTDRKQIHPQVCIESCEPDRHRMLERHDLTFPLCQVSSFRCIHNGRENGDEGYLIWCRFVVTIPVNFVIFLESDYGSLYGGT